LRKNNSIKTYKKLASWPASATDGVDLPAVLVESHDVTLVFDAGHGREVAVPGRVDLVGKVVGAAAGLDMLRTVIPQ
jgi:hypothetical protein